MQCHCSNWECFSFSLFLHKVKVFNFPSWDWNCHKESSGTQWNQNIAGLLSRWHLSTGIRWQVPQGGHQEDLQTLPVSHSRQEDLQRTADAETHEPWKCELILLCLPLIIIISLYRLLVFWTCLPLNVLWMNSLMCTWWPTSWGLTSTTSSGLRGEKNDDPDNLSTNKVFYRLSDDHVQFLVYQIVRGMKYVHSAGIIHRWDRPLAALWQHNCSL